MARIGNVAVCADLKISLRAHNKYG